MEPSKIGVGCLEYANQNDWSYKHWAIGITNDLRLPVERLQSVNNFNRGYERPILTNLSRRIGVWIQRNSRIIRTVFTEIILKFPRIHDESKFTYVQIHPYYSKKKKLLCMKFDAAKFLNYKWKF